MQRATWLAHAVEERLRGGLAPVPGRRPGTQGLQDRVATDWHDRFNRLADRVTNALGSLPALVGSVLLVVVWALTGPLFHFSDTWQLFINTTTTVVTFWMVFVIQNSANRASKATQLKLDELIRAVHDARNEFIELDRAPETVLAAREQELIEIAESGRLEASAQGDREDRPPSASR
jgi:low affinity Fe/Cu permease